MKMKYVKEGQLVQPKGSKNVYKIMEVIDNQRVVGKPVTVRNGEFQELKTDNLYPVHKTSSGFLFQGRK